MNDRRLLFGALILLMTVTRADAFLCGLPIIGFLFRLFFPFLCEVDAVDGAPTPSPKTTPVSEATPSPETTPMSGPTPSPLPEADDGLPVGPSGIFVGFDYAGCFKKQESNAEHLVSAPSINERAVECRNACTENKLFGVVEESCFCYTEFNPPRARLSIGSCSTVSDGTPDVDRMELYVTFATDENCFEEQTKAVRDNLVLQDSAQFGFDIVENTFRDSMFEFTTDQCGTNIYEVNIEASETAGSLKTSVSGVVEFAESQRQERARSWAASAEVGYKGALVQASLKVSASGDTATNDLLKSSGAESTASKVFTSLGIRRTAQVRIKDFERTYSFVSFSREFANLLTAYRNSLADEVEAKKIGYEIIEKYGQFVLTRALYGGYLQYRSTIVGSDISAELASEADMSKCFEQSVKGSASGFGFSGGFEGERAGCDRNQQDAFNKTRDKFKEETLQLDIVGGTVDYDSNNKPFLSVPPGLAVLLKENDKYPTAENDNGVEFRLLSDFLDPEKISPLEVRKWLITEEEFSLMQQRLQGHILDYLEEVSGIIGGSCGCFATKSIPYVNADRTCSCYNAGVLLSMDFEKEEYAEYHWSGYAGGLSAEYASSGGNPGGNVRVPAREDARFRSRIGFYLVSPHYVGVEGCTFRFDLKVDSLEFDDRVSVSTSECCGYGFTVNSTEWTTYEGVFCGCNLEVSISFPAGSGGALDNALVFCPDI